VLQPADAEQQHGLHLGQISKTTMTLSMSREHTVRSLVVSL
jgi:hypothetical protein